MKEISNYKMYVSLILNDLVGPIKDRFVDSVGQ